MDGEHNYVDPNWCFENPEEAAEELMQRQRYIDRLEAAGDALDKAFGAIMPGVKYIALQDYSVLNAGYDWQQARKDGEAAPERPASKATVVDDHPGKLRDAALVLLHIAEQVAAGKMRREAGGLKITAGKKHAHVYADLVVTEVETPKPTPGPRSVNFEPGWGPQPRPAEDDPSDGA